METLSPFFPIVRTPLFANFNDEQVAVSRDALINGITGDVLGTVGRTYKVVENTQVDELFAEAFADLPVESTKDHLNGTTNRWQRDIILSGDRFTSVVGGDGRDLVKTKVSIFNGYDGKTSVGFNISGYRQVCTNGLMGWKKLLGGTYNHISHNIIERIRKDFESNLSRFERIRTSWEDMSRQSYSRAEFERFVMERVKTESNEGYLSDKQAKDIIAMYEPVLNRYQDNETKWGAANVLTAIQTHHTSARSGSNVFSQGYKRMERLVTDFFESEGHLFTM